MLPTTIWRVRQLSCDGGRIGREWAAEFFFNKDKAENRLAELISDNNKRNPKYPFKTKQEVIDGVSGFCNWQFLLMIAIDTVEIKQ